MATRTVSFPNAAGDPLAGRLETPLDGAPHAWAVFAHCFTCGKDLRAAVRLSRALADEGIGVLRFDFTGLGESGGTFEGTSFTSTVDDIVAAHAWLASEYDAPRLLIGHSLGGPAVIAAAARLPSVSAVATIGAPSDPSHVEAQFATAVPTIEREGVATVRIGQRDLRVTRGFLRDIRTAALDDALAALGARRAALLFMHAPADAIVPIEHAAHLYQAARHPKSFVSLDDADHLLAREADARYAAGVLAAWSARYIGSTPERTMAEVEAGTTASARTVAGGLRTAMRVGGFPQVADEPRAVGGTEEGPTPYDYLAAALAACTSMTLTLYAGRKGWPLAAVDVAVRHERVHAKDDAEADGQSPPRLDRLSRTITLEGELDETQRTRLAEIADRCPVHRTLHAGVEIVTGLSSPV